MIKFFGLIPRLPGLSELEFHDHYRHPHGTYGSKNRGFVQYVQSHMITPDVSPLPTSIFEAVAEVWFDNFDVATSLADDPNYVAYLKEDEVLFVDLPRLKWLYTDEKVLRIPMDPAHPYSEAEKMWVVNGSPTTLKVLQFVNGTDPVDEAEQASLASRLGALRTTRCNALADYYADEAPAFPAARELWWPTEFDFLSGVARDPEAWTALLALPEGSETLVAKAERFI